jgi:hypothetical protein
MRVLALMRMLIVCASIKKDIENLSNAEVECFRLKNIPLYCYGLIKTAIEIWIKHEKSEEKLIIDENFKSYFSRY